MRALRDSFRKVRALVGGYRPWRWWVLVALALFVTLLEAVGALLIFVLMAVIASPEALLEIPFAPVEILTRVGDDPAAVRISVASVIGVFFLVRLVVVVTRIYAQERVAANSGAAVADELLRGYLTMPYLSHTQRAVAELVRNAYDATQQLVFQVLRPMVLLAAESALALGLIVVLLVTASLPTLLAVVVFVPTIWLLQRGVQPVMSRLGRQSQDARSMSIAALQQSLAGLRDIRVLGRERAFAERHVTARRSLARSDYLRMTLLEVPRAVIETALVVTIVLVLIVSTTAGLAFEELLATLGLFAYVGLRLHPSLQKVVSSLNELRFGGALLDDLTEDLMAMRGRARSLDRPSESGPATAPDFTDELSLSDVDFSYGDQPVLQGIDLEVEPGEFIGICGPTGSGKSTLVDLLVGLLQPTAGSIKVDGVDLGRWPTWWWRRIGLVSQQVYLTDDTLRANIAFGLDAEDMDDERLLACVADAQLEELVSSLPEGLETRVGERGVRLSGGQRQRVAIARALYVDPEVLVLDEGTSALDAATEAALVAAIDGGSRRRTTIAVAHRIGTIRHADRIVVLAAGRIVEEGAYEDLLADSVLFQSLSR